MTFRIVFELSKQQRAQEHAQSSIWKAGEPLVGKGAESLATPVHGAGKVMELEDTFDTWKNLCVSYSLALIST